MTKPLYLKTVICRMSARSTDRIKYILDEGESLPKISAVYLSPKF